MPDASTTSAPRLRFHHQTKTVPANHTPNTFVSQTKFVLSDSRDPDTVVCLIVRKRVKASRTELEGAAEASTMAKELEDDLRDIAEDYKVFG